MGKRLSKIYTRQGDAGTTGLGTNDRVRKSSARIAAIGDVDELNSWIGCVRTALDPQQAELDRALSQIQHDLFDLGGELAMPGYTLMSQTTVAELESHIDQLNESLPALENFILPAGGEATVRIHVARSIARRAERQVWALSEAEADHADAAPTPLALQYLNRLSDYLFVLARTVARGTDGEEVLWQSRHER